MDWAEKYRPMHVREVVGNGEAIRRMVEWAQGWSPASKPLILYGKPGIGKTSSALALARDLGWEVVELNASDQRTRAVIERIAGEGSTTGSLLGAERKLILLDEADNIQGTADRGGVKAIASVIAHARQPVILIANDLYGVSQEVRSLCEPVQFRAVQARQLPPYLKSICHREGIACGDDALLEIATHAGGDIRAAVTMLHAAAVGKTALSASDIRSGSKDARKTLFDLISGMYGRVSDDDLLKLSWDLDESPDTTIQWIEANLSHLSDPGRIALAYRALSKADLYIGRTYRLQYYTLWRYATSLMLLGAGAATGGCGIRARIMPPSRWSRMASGRKQKAVRQAVISGISRRNHMSDQLVRDEFIQPLGIIADADPAGFVRTYGFGADELEFLTADKSKAQAAVRAVKAERDAEEKRRAKEEKEREKLEKKALAKVGLKPENRPDAAAPMDEARAPLAGERPAAVDPEEKAPIKKDQKKVQSSLFEF